jgi:hypothetical protein
VVTARPRRVAVLGGDGRHAERWSSDGEVVHFQAPGDGGNGDLRRLQSALRAGSIGLVVIVARWNSHSATTAVRTLCKKHGIRVQIA